VEEPDAGCEGCFPTGRGGTVREGIETSDRRETLGSRTTIGTTIAAAILFDMVSRNLHVEVRIVQTTIG